MAVSAVEKFLSWSYMAIVIQVRRRHHFFQARFISVGGRGRSCALIGALSSRPACLTAFRIIECKIRKKELLKCVFLKVNVSYQSSDN